MQIQANVVWKDGLAFGANVDGFNFTIDADEEFGGKNLGPKPKGLTMVSLAGCTAMDVVSILRKMHVEMDYFEVAVDGVTGDAHPKKFDKAVIKYIFKGKDLPLDKIKKAINLSLETYCGVYATLQPAVNMTSKIIINGQEVDG